MSRAAMIFLLAACPGIAVSAESPCTYVAGYAGASDWLVTQGPAVVTASKGRFTAKLYDTRLGGDESHRLEGAIKDGQVSATLKNLFSDAGDDRVVGHYSLTQNDPGAPGKVYESLTLQNGLTFVGIRCSDSKANLTTARTPTRAKAARAGDAGR
jgi:hypothetical protein